MLSLWVGTVVGVIYCVSLQKTAFGISNKAKIEDMRRVLTFFSLRLLLIALVFLFLARFTELNMSFVIVSFITVFSLFLFYMAAKAFFYDMNKRQTQSRRRI